MAQERQIAANILTKAVSLDEKKRFTEALICYQEGLAILITIMQRMESSEYRTQLQKRISTYMVRAEKIKKYVEAEKNKNTYHEQIIIEDNSEGHSYKSIFSRFLDDSLTEIEIDDPYIRAFHQCQNFLRFCELVVKSCENLRTLTLNTVANNSDQDEWLKQLQSELARCNVKLEINYSPSLHDREIRMDNGWIIKIGRGLDYFKAPESKFSLGVFDLDLRKCHATTVDIFHNKVTTKRYG